MEGTPNRPPLTKEIERTKLCNSPASAETLPRSQHWNRSLGRSKKFEFKVKRGPTKTHLAFWNEEILYPNPFSFPPKVFLCYAEPLTKPYGAGISASPSGGTRAKPQGLKVRHVLAPRAICASMNLFLMVATLPSVFWRDTCI